MSYKRNNILQFVQPVERRLNDPVRMTDQELLWEWECMDFGLGEDSQRGDVVEAEIEKRLLNI